MSAANAKFNLMRRLIFILLALLALPACSGPGEAQSYTYEVVNAYPHDMTAFTQGLVYDDGFLYEGTGLEGRSSLRKVELSTGKVLQIVNLPDDVFGEGITILDDRIIQLTWKSKTGFVYDRNSFAMVGEFAYATEGWGLTNDGEQLIMSDGTAMLYFLNPQTFALTGSIEVSYKGTPVTKLNELEYVKGEVYANVWQTDRIARVSPKTGEVAGWVDLSGLLARENYQGNADVLNGIAFDAKSERLFVTGKLWPKVYEIRLVPQGEGEGNEEIPDCCAAPAAGPVGFVP